LEAKIGKLRGKNREKYETENKKSRERLEAKNRENWRRKIGKIGGGK